PHVVSVNPWVGGPARATGLLPGHFQNISGVRAAGGVNAFAAIDTSLPFTGATTDPAHAALNFLFGDNNTFTIGSDPLFVKILQQSKLGQSSAGPLLQVLNRTVGKQLNRFAPGIHVLAGSRGSDTYKFDALYFGLAGVLELPDVQIEGVSV